MKRIRTISFIGAGYVGGSTGAVFASQCSNLDIIVADVDKSRIDQWNSECLPVFEPGLQDLVSACRDVNLFFLSDVNEAIRRADIIFITVNTPTKNFGYGKGRAADLRYVESVARTIARAATGSKIVVEKSTVPVKCAQGICRILDANRTSGFTYQVLSNPEFMSEGTAIEDLMSPDRVLIGGQINNEDGIHAVNILSQIYACWIPAERIITMNTWSSELSKLISNAFLAQRISAINSVSAICEATGADVGEVARAVGEDRRIGRNYLKASIGFGGSCFPKDILNLVYMCETLNLHEVAEFWMSVIRMNHYQTKRFAKRIISCLFNTVAGKTITIYGFAFKKDTSDTRESPAISLCRELLADGACLNIYDPKVPSDQIQRELGEGSAARDAEGTLAGSHVRVLHDPYEAAEASHAIVICTEWEEFKTFDYGRIFDNMLKPAYLFDGRRIINRELVISYGFHVETIGTTSDTYTSISSLNKSLINGADSN